MARPGPKPKPTEVKKRAGNPGKRKLNTEEPKPVAENLPCPSQLEGLARIEWNRVAPVLAKLGILTRMDETALMGYCTAYARWVDAEQNIRKFGGVIKTPTGYPIQNPYLGIANTALDQMRKFAVEFGMTPSSRSHLHVTPQAEDTNAFAEIAAETFTVQ